MMIALLCSVHAEAEPLLPRIASARTVTTGSKTIVEGRIEGRDVLLCTGGMGKVNAAHASTLLISLYNPEALIIFGIGGAYPGSGARPGDLAVATREIAGDEGVLTAEGFRDTEYMGIPLVNSPNSLNYNIYPAPEPLLDRIRKQRAFFGHGGKVLDGPFITLSSCTGTTVRSKELEKRHKGLCENMEGAAAAQVAVLHNLPWGELRGISNLVQDRDLKKWDIAKAAEAAAKAVIQVVKRWEQ